MPENSQWPESGRKTSSSRRDSSQSESPPGDPRDSRKEPPEKKSWMDYVNVTSGGVSAVIALIALFATLQATHVIGPGVSFSKRSAAGKSTTLTKTPHLASSSATTSSASPVVTSASPVVTSASPVVSPTPPVVPVTTQRLQDALLNVGIFSPPASVISTADSPSQLESICGAPLQGADFASFEDIQFDDQGMYFQESIVAWPSASAAAASISSLQSALDSGGCQLGSTSYSGASTGTAPASCQQPGEYLATGAATSGGIFQYVGEGTTVQCGAVVFWVQVTGDLPPYPDQETADRYLGMAVDKFNATTS